MFKQPFKILPFILAMFLFCAGASVNAKSIAKEKLSNAVQTDFFTWFHFSEKERKKEPGDKVVVRYQTQMHEHEIELGVTLDKDEHVTDMVLILPRKFVDDPKDKMFASDIAKSFISTAVPDADASQVEDLINDIAFRGSTWQPVKNVTVEEKSTGKKQPNATLLKQGDQPLKKGDNAWIGVSDVPTLKEKPTPGFLAYVGEKTHYEQTLPDKTLLRIANQDKGGEKLVVLVVNTQ